MLREGKIKRLLRRRLRIGGRSVSIGLIAVIGVALLASGGAVYARLGGSDNDPNTTINLQRGLVGWWKLNGDAKDTTPYANNGTPVGGASLTADRKGTANQAYSLNGTTGYISVPAAPSVNVYSSFTLSAWVNLSSYGSASTVMAKRSGNNEQWAVRIISATSIRIEWNDGAWRTYSASLPSVLTLNQYHHVAVSYDGTTLMFYVDGVAYSGSGSAPSFQSYPSSALCLGQDCVNTAGRFVNGTIDDVRVYNRAVSTAEAKALHTQYDSQIAAASGEKGLVGWWKLNGSTKDATPYAGDGAVVNGAVPTIDRKGAANGAYSFNGTNQYISLPASTKLIVGQPGMTVSAWIKPSTLSGTMAVFNRNGPYLLWIDGVSKRLYTGLLVGATWYWAYSATNSLVANQWQHIAMTFDGTSRRLYVNGVQSGPTDVQVSGNISTTNAGPRIGMDPAAGGRFYFNGSIGDVRVYNRALSGQEVARQADSYNSQINLNSSPSAISGSGNINAGLVGYWPFSGNAKDATPYQSDGLPVNASLAPDRRGAANSAYSFNGSSSAINIANTASQQQNYTGFSVSLWAKTSVTVTDYTYLVHRDNTQNIGGSVFGMILMPNNHLSWAWQGGYTVGESASYINDGIWHHIVGTWDGANARLYLDNNLIKTYATTSGTNKPTAATTLGGTSFNTSAFRKYNGSLDNVRMYNRALSITEISNLYGNYR